MLKWIAQNKYKLMVFIIGLYLVVDVLQHKGEARVLLDETFIGGTTDSSQPKSNSILINNNKVWKKAINTREKLDALSAETAGFECDVYFDTVNNSFDVHHDPDKSTGFGLNDLLKQYRQRKLTASIWLDIKNLGGANSVLALQSLLKLRKEYQLQNKILVESGRADLLTAFSDSGFFSSYYVPFFNPYKTDVYQTGLRTYNISSAINKAKINALSGYYFQYPFLHYYFPNYPVLTWVDNNSLSLVNFLFQKKLASDRSVFIVLKP